ncbi:MAG TPA: SPOR domain-containing protein [Burkholderiales bacterium]|nr:SPOR domain-containing protein [Burkholderiales bacterium]
MPDNDETLELRRRARRRLVGAVALVLALVIIPPWVMDLEPKPVATNLTVEIPRQETGALKPTPAAPARAPAPASTSAVAPTSTGAPAEADKQGGAVPRPPDVSPSTGKAGERPKPEAEAAKPPPNPEAVARVAPQEPARGDIDAKRAEAILNSEAYLVPLGAFANKDNVKALEAKLAKAGVKYYTEVVTTPAGEQTRVRAGPFATKEAAEKSREHLKSLGLSPGAVIARQ